MDLRRLRYILAIAREGGFTAAARSLNVSQPTLSQQVRDLEQELGVTLFARNAHRVEATDAGKLVLEHAERVLDAVAALTQAVEEHRGLRRGRLRMGVTQTFSALYLPAIVEDFARDYPLIDLELLELANADIEAGVEDGRLHLGIGVPRRDTMLRAVPLYEDRLMFVCSERHPLSIQAVVGVEQLAALSMAFLSRQFHTRLTIEAFLSAAKVTPRRVLEFNTFAAILAALRSGEHATIMPASGTGLPDGGGLPEGGGLRFLPISPPPTPRQICLMVRHGKAHLSPGTLAMIERIERRFKGG